MVAPLECQPYIGSWKAYEELAIEGCSLDTTVESLRDMHYHKTTPKLTPDPCVPYQ